MKVSIIILTYNSENFIEKLLKSIDEHNKGLDFEILIVDNASSDKTLEVVRKTDKSVRIIETGENMGFAKGINFGAKKAKGEYLLFVNPDAEWSKGSIDDLVSVFEKNEKVGIVGGKIVDLNNKTERSAGKFLKTFESLFIAVGLDEALNIRFSPNREMAVDFVSGGFMMVRSNLFERLSGFDEKLFMYVEDMELCFRAKQASFLTYFTPSVVLRHASHGSSNRSFAIINVVKGISYFQKKHGSTASYHFVKSLYKTKAVALVLIGKIINNKYLSDTYSEVLKL